MIHHVLEPSVKPRLRKVRKFWACKGGGFVGHGASPLDAYSTWRMLRDLGRAAEALRRREQLDLDRPIAARWPARPRSLRERITYAHND